MKKMFFTVAMVVFLAIFASAQASVIDTLGDKDCFGFDGTCTSGSLWRNGLGGSLGFLGNYQDAGDPSFTDKWSADPAVTYYHTISPLDGVAINAVLQIMTAGIADNEYGENRGPWTVRFNNRPIGAFTTNYSANSFQEIRRFDFLVPLDLLTGTTATIFLDINNTGSPYTDDGYSIDYSELTINTLPVPEPSTMLLLGLGLAGLTGIRRRKS